ncbi:agamous-like MADS-box AGL18 [Olea europaea subsp. europaea]|uniref:Agamous-like MADS-box AGL18 n=1 Tax=Olea europaea subsp. europaea TaxID=158383 RepID=A0A8S0S930_OLEEU|nr:agamous-like MADS-box AGL18 [Olea europaea subsp. europaea]
MRRFRCYFFDDEEFEAQKRRNLDEGSNLNMQRVELSYYSKQSFVLNPKTLDFDLGVVGNMDYGVELEDKEDIEGNFGVLDFELMEEPMEVEVHAEVNALKDELEKLKLMHRRMLGKELGGLSLQELQDMEHKLSEGAISVKNEKEKKLLEKLEKSKLQRQKVVQQNEALREQVEKLKHRVGLSRSHHLIGRKNYGTALTPVREASSDISLSLE